MAPVCTVRAGYEPDVGGRRDAVHPLPDPVSTGARHQSHHSGVHDRGHDLRGLSRDSGDNRDVADLQAGHRLATPPRCARSQHGAQPCDEIAALPGDYLRGGVGNWHRHRHGHHAVDLTEGSVDQRDRAAAGGGGSSGGSSGGDDNKSSSGGDDKKSSSSSDNKSSSSSGGKSSSSSGQSSTGGGSGGGSSSAQPSSTGMGGGAGSDDKSGQDNKGGDSDNKGDDDKNGAMPSFSGVPAVVAGVVGVVVAALI